MTGKYKKPYSQNIDKMHINNANDYGIPALHGVRDFKLPENWIPFNLANTYKGNRENTGVHFFTDDYRFERVWRSPCKYINMLRSYRAVIAPDFSMYSDFPLAMRIWNCYRNMWLGKYYQSKDINIIPKISFALEDSFDWCFEGMPKGGIVAISSVGSMKNSEYKRNFTKGFNKAIEILQPTQILFHGQVPEGIDLDNIINIPCYTYKFN